MSQQNYENVVTILNPKSLVGKCKNVGAAHLWQNSDSVEWRLSIYAMTVASFKH